jgi:hypothetical protein
LRCAPHPAARPDDYAPDLRDGSINTRRTFNEEIAASRADDPRCCIPIYPPTARGNLTLSPSDSICSERITPGCRYR